MNARRLLRLFLLLLAGAAARLGASTPVIGEQLFQETNAQIENMFHNRLNPPLPPGPYDNPFRVGDTPPAGGVGPSSNPGQPASQPAVVTDDSLLREAAGGLVFGGLLQIGDVQVLVINKTSYKEGGILSVRIQGQTVYLRIVSITSNTVTLGLNEARLTLHF